MRPKARDEQRHHRGRIGVDNDRLPRSRAQSEDEQPPSLSVVVFAYNEAANIAPVLNELVQWLEHHEPRAEVVFVDDGSSDSTWSEAKTALLTKTATVLRHDKNQGIGAALKTGVRAARAPWVTFLPADGQVPPEAIGRLREGAAREHADIVLSVYERRDDGFHRKVLSAGVRALIFAFHGVWLRSDGPYLFRRSLFIPDQLRPDSFFLNFEFPLRVTNAGLRVATVAVPCRPRRSGTSKSAGLKSVVRVAGDLVELRLRRISEGLARWF